MSSTRRDTILITGDRSAGDRARREEEKTLKPRCFRFALRIISKAVTSLPGIDKEQVMKTRLGRFLAIVALLMSIGFPSKLKADAGALPYIVRTEVIKINASCAIVIVHYSNLDRSSSVYCIA